MPSTNGISDLQVQLEAMMELAAADDLPGLRSMIEDYGAIYPVHWQAPVGRLILRFVTLCAVTKNSMRVVKHLCGERGVPPLADDPEGWGESYLVLYFLSPLCLLPFPLALVPRRSLSLPPHPFSY